MKVLKITAKNLKILLRSKTSLLMIVFGPLLIMLLVGFAFNNTSVSKLNVGYYSPDTTNLTQSFVKALQDNPNFLVISYTSHDQCLNMIEQGKVHLCIIFPEDFNVENNKTNQLEFYVDQSRANFVYSIIDTVSSKVSLTSSQLSYQMTNDLLLVIENSRKANTDELAKIASVKSSINDISSKIDGVKGKLSELDLSAEDTGDVSLETMSSNLRTEIDQLESTGLDFVDYVRDNKAGSNISNSNVNDAEDDLVSQANATQASLDEMILDIEEVLGSIDELNTKLALAKSATSSSSSTLDQNIQTLGEVKTQLDSLKSSIETTNAQINALRITSAESIVNPIQTIIKPVSSTSSNLNFIFPYFIILIIVFIGIMLSSNIIIVEKTSKAYFRNFTTPTRDMTFVVSVFLTSFLVVLLQLVFILALAYYFLNTSIIENIGLTGLMIVCAIALFTLIGMVIGYLFNSQESVMMASISVGSVFLFLSNLILPLESMAGYIQEAAKFNPYVLSSELLKKLTVFNSTWNEVYMDFILIGAYIVVAFILVLLVQKASKVHFISKKPITKQLLIREASIDKYFKLKNGVLLMSEKDLLEELEKMKDEQFEEYVNKKRNDFESWLEMNKKHELAKRLGQCKTRKDMIALLKKHKDEVAVKTEK